MHDSRQTSCPTDLGQIHTTAVEAARAAGHEALQRWQGQLGTRYKGRRDLVTDADFAAEEAVIRLIRERFPDHAILAEETGVTNSPSAPSAYQWIVDPIDGTTNYSRGLPMFASSVAVAYHGRPVAGAVHDPVCGWTFHAMRGGGAYCNDEPITCSTRQDLIELVVEFDWGREDSVRARMAQVVHELEPDLGGWRTLGSATLSLCYVAYGSCDAYVHGALGAWDLAAGGLIIEEAGGRVTSLDGSPAWWEHSTCLASNGLVHDQLLARIAWPSRHIPTR